jgi:phosphosulfolactate synthase
MTSTEARLDASATERPTTAGLLDALGVAPIAPRTSPFDPGYDPVTLESHLDQSGHLMSALKISMACWLVADEASTRRKFAAAKTKGVPTVTGGGPFEVSVAQGRLEEYLDLCQDVGAVRIECGGGFTKMTLEPKAVMAMAAKRGLDVQFEVGDKHAGAFDGDTTAALIRQGQEWLDAGAKNIVIEARESAENVGLFHRGGELDRGLADRFAEQLGLDTVLFEAPNKPAQFALLRHFGRDVELCNVRLEEILRVEIYRRGLHSDAFGVDKLRPVKNTEASGNE